MHLIGVKGKHSQCDSGCVSSLLNPSSHTFKLQYQECKHRLKPPFRRPGRRKAVRCFPARFWSGFQGTCLEVPRELTTAQIVVVSGPQIPVIYRLLTVFCGVF
jgi:hypothetical protein